MIIGLGTSIFCANAPNSGESTPSAPTNITPPNGFVMLGGGYVGSLATVNSGTWNNADSLSGQWQRFDIVGWVDIPGETGLYYTFTEADAALSIRYLETATNAGGDTSEPSNSLTPLALYAPSIGGYTPNAYRAGGDLQCDADNFGNPLASITYEWNKYADGFGAEFISNDNPAIGAALVFSPNYIYCNVTWTNSQGSASAQSGSFSDS